MFDESVFSKLTDCVNHQKKNWILLVEPKDNMKIKNILQKPIFIMFFSEKRGLRI